jgi:hypothetical protein
MKYSRTKQQPEVTVSRFPLSFPLLLFNFEYLYGNLRVNLGQISRAETCCSLGCRCIYTAILAKSGGS